MFTNEERPLLFILSRNKILEFSAMLYKLSTNDFITSLVTLEDSYGIYILLDRYSSVHWA